jgi:hypothetical protein
MNIHALHLKLRHRAVPLNPRPARSRKGEDTGQNSVCPTDPLFYLSSFQISAFKKYALGNNLHNSLFIAEGKAHLSLNLPHIFSYHPVRAGGGHGFHDIGIVGEIIRGQVYIRYIGLLCRRFQGWCQFPLLAIYTFYGKTARKSPQTPQGRGHCLGHYWQKGKPGKMVLNTYSPTF